MSSSLSGHPAEASKPKLLDHAPGVKNLPLLGIAHVLVRFGHVLYKIADS
jgi:hypothetical protein